MKVEYSRRAIADLYQISISSRRLYGDRIAEALGLRIRGVVDRISRTPLSAPKVEQRPAIHVAPLVRYPFKIFYRIFDDKIRILHIRHTSRRPWPRAK